MKIFIKILLVSIFYTAIHVYPARAADSPPNDEEIKQFLVAYKNTELASQPLWSTTRGKYATQRTPSQIAYFSCLAEKVFPASYEPAALAASRELFGSSAQLRELTVFYESVAGQKRQKRKIFAWQKPMNKAESERDDSYPSDLQFTDADQANIKLFESSPNALLAKTFWTRMSGIITQQSVELIKPGAPNQCGIYPNGR